MKYAFILAFSLFFINSGFSQSERIKDRAERSAAMNAVEAENGGEKVFAKYAERYRDAVKNADSESQSAIKKYLVDSMTQIIDAKKNQMKMSAMPSKLKKAAAQQQDLAKKIKKTNNAGEVEQIIAAFEKTI